jgi:hypothetical protein
MDDILADDPDQAPPSASERQDEPNERWQAMRWRAFKRTDLHCEHCQAEQGKQILRYLYDPPTKWQPFVIGAPRRLDLYVTTVRLVVVPTIVPWTGEEADLEVLCLGCFIWRDAMAAYAARQATRTDLRGQLALLG